MGLLVDGRFTRSQSSPLCRSYKPTATVFPGFVTFPGRRLLDILELLPAEGDDVIGAIGAIRKAAWLIRPHDDMMRMSMRSSKYLQELPHRDGKPLSLLFIA